MLTEAKRVKTALGLAQGMRRQSERLTALLADPRPGFDGWNEDVNATLVTLDATYRRMLYLKLSVVPGRRPPRFEMEAP